MKLIEAIGSLIIMVIMIPILAEWWLIGITETQKRQAADHLATVNKADPTMRANTRPRS